MPSNRTALLRTFFLVLLAATLGGIHGVPFAEQRSAASAGSVASGPKPLLVPSRAALSPRMREIQVAVEEARAMRERLEERQARAASAAEADALQKELVVLKTDTEIRLLQVQAKYARLAGRPEQVARIERAIEHRLHPPQPILRAEPAGSDLPQLPRH